MAIEIDANGLQRVAVLGLLEPEALRIVAFSSEQHEVRAGDDVFRRGETMPGAIVVIEGALELLTEAREPAIERVLAEGALYGDTALIVDYASPGRLRGRERSIVLVVQRRLFRRVLSEFPASADKVRRFFADRLNHTVDQMRVVGERLLAIGKP